MAIKMNTINEKLLQITKKHYLKQKKQLKEQKKYLRYHQKLNIRVV
ncbi:hypothetical protein [Proteiniborus sp. MB09-C3]|nr:hypothetical protein [Proteiniborus sp. MB09-C3]WIV13130.1 hypothetical protein QO263_05310 [Proteiniborus sp. MB09-C3]